MSWTDDQIQSVWEKGRIIQGIDPAEWRCDDCTAWILRDQYGNRNSIYGWEVDHIDPDAGDDLPNLRPLQWKNNASKQDSKSLTCPVTAKGNYNIEHP